MARRYDANANLVFTWLRDPRFRPDEVAVEEHAGFLPVEVIAEGREVRCDIGAPAAEGRIELELVSGQRLRVVGTYDPEALALHRTLALEAHRNPAGFRWTLQSGARRVEAARARATVASQAAVRSTH